MITLEKDALVFRFPNVHASAELRIDFQRTLRIPDDDRDYPLPAGLGRFPLEHVDDYSDSIPQRWLEHGGIMLPMYQCEAMWLNFESDYIRDHQTAYPFAIKIAAGKINAVNGDEWGPGLKWNEQNYAVVPGQPWLDGFCIEQGVIRQFVAARLGEGVTVEEQATGEAQHGGLQIQVFPMKRQAFDRRFPKVDPMDEHIRMARCRGFAGGDSINSLQDAALDCVADSEMGLAMGGRMRQQIYKDQFNLVDWDLENTSRCFVHLANSQAWQMITGKPAPRTPVTERKYRKQGIPWFDHYRELPSVPGSSKLRDLKSIREFDESTGASTDLNPISVGKVIRTGNVVRESEF